MSLIVDKQAVMQDVMRAINKHYASYEQNINEMESIIKQLPLVQQLIKENDELKRRLESENIQLNVKELNTSSHTVDINEDIKKEMKEHNEMTFKAFHEMMTKQTEASAKPIIVKKEDADQEDSDTIHAVSGDSDDISQELMIDTDLNENIEEEYEEEEEEEDSGSQPLEEDEDSGSQPREEEDGDSGSQPREEEDSGSQPREEEEEEEDSGSQPLEEEEEEEEAEEEVFEINIEDTVYYTTNDTNGEIYSCTIDGDVGDSVGHFDNGNPVFT